MTEPIINLQNAKVFAGSNLDILPTLADNSVDAIVTDPPYELGFMGKSWDSTGIAYSVELWRECLRVLKPGGHILAFGGSRTWHRLAVAIEDSGFELRDSIAWLYGSGFPKSLDVAKAIDKAAGAEREVIGSKMASPKGISGAESRSDTAAGAYGGEAKLIDITAPATHDAKKWDGWGTALKPAFEPVVVGRKPLIGTVAANVLEWGTGALNIDASRIGFRDEADRKESTAKNQHADFGTAPMTGNTTYGDYSMIQPKNYDPVGRWPANIILDDYTAQLLDDQSGVSVSKSGGRSTGRNFGQQADSDFTKDRERTGHNDSGGASRFFYVAKASKKDRNEGLDGLPEQASSNYGSIQEHSNNPPKANFHPTVKPTELMRYLIKLVTPPGGTVLDPFTGSGSTGKAALLDGFDFIGIELTPEYLPIIEGRLKWAENKRQDDEQKKITENANSLFEVGD
jgi:site-specific DNA-methyltransferase (adenine-specific)